MRQTASLKVYPVKVYNFAVHTNCTSLGRTADADSVTAKSLTFYTWLLSVVLLVFCFVSDFEVLEEPFQPSSVFPCSVEKWINIFSVLIHWWVTEPVQGQNNYMRLKLYQKWGQGLSARKSRYTRFSSFTVDSSKRYFCCIRFVLFVLILIDRCSPFFFLGFCHSVLIGCIERARFCDCGIPCVSHIYKYLIASGY